jgi:hypothetical protein
VYLYIHVYVLEYVCIHMYVFMYVFMNSYVWTYSSQFTDLPAAVNLSSTGGDNEPIFIDINEY